MENEKKKPQRKPKSKTRKIIEWVITGIFLVLFAIVGFAQIDGMIHKKDHYGHLIRFGYSNYVVETNSMEPKYMKGSAIIDYLEDADKIYARYQKGEEINVTFMDVYQTRNEYTTPKNNPQLTTRTPVTNVPMTHQVKEILVNPNANKGAGKYTFITAGINTGVSAATDANGQIYQYQAFTEKELLGVVVANSAVLGGIFGFVGSIYGLLILLLIPALYLIITSVIDIFKAYKEPEAETAFTPKENKGNLDLSEEDKKRLKEELLAEMLNKKKGGE